MNFFKSLSRPRLQYYTPERTKDTVVVHLAPARSPLEKVPIELVAFVPRVMWAERLETILQFSAKYHHPRLEGSYLVITILFAIFLAIALYQVVLRDMLYNIASYIQATAICIGIFAATVFITLLPFALWEWNAHKRLNDMLETWKVEDQRGHGLEALMPIWKCERKGLSREIKVTITIPMLQTSSSFGFHTDLLFNDYVRTHGQRGLSLSRPAPVVVGEPRDTIVGDLPLFSPLRGSFRKSNV